jgi:hypothetical protein
LEPGVLHRKLSEEGEKLHRMASTIHAVTFGTVKDDPRWSSPLPLRFDIQIRHLFGIVLDAFALALQGLSERASPAALGSLRLMAETSVTMAWLCEEPHPSERNLRAMRHLLGTLRRAQQHVTKDMAMSDDAALRTTAKAVKDAIEHLKGIAREDGFKILREAPGRQYLFDRFLGDYAAFATLSELGSHPGPLYLAVFHITEPGMVDVRETGAELERAFFLAWALQQLAATCETTGAARGWEPWLVRDWRPTVEVVRPLMVEAHQRWNERWEASAD